MSFARARLYCYGRDTNAAHAGRCDYCKHCSWHYALVGAENVALVHLIYLAEACVIEHWLRVAGIQHLHAHFGTNPVEVAMLVHALGGPQWSFTVHGPEEYDNVRALGIGRKNLSLLAQLSVLMAEVNFIGW